MECSAVRSTSAQWQAQAGQSRQAHGQERARIPFASVVPRPDRQGLRRLLTQAMTQKPALKGNVPLITIAILLPLGFWLMGELKFFVPYDLILWRAYATPILGTSESWPSMCFPLRSFSSASFSSRTPDENCPTSASRGVSRALPPLEVFSPALHCAASHRISSRRKAFPLKRQAAARIRRVRRNPPLPPDSPEVGNARVRCTGDSRL